MFIFKTRYPKIIFYIWINDNETIFHQTTKSILKNHYPNYEIIKVNPTKTNELEFITGYPSSGWTIFLYSGDIINPFALFKLAKLSHTNKHDIIFFDDSIQKKDEQINTSRYKPSYSSHYLNSYNFIGNSFMVSRSILPKSIPIVESFDGIVWQLLLSFSQQGKSFYHQSGKFLDYALRPTPAIGSLKAMLEATTNQGQTALSNESAVFKRNIILIEKPLISILIPFKDKPELLATCVNSILKKGQYPNIEIIGISNNSNEKETFKLMKTLSDDDDRIRFIEHNIPFNFSTLNNKAATLAKGKHLVLLNNDIEIISEDWLKEMLYFSEQKDVGAVGARLYYANDTVQHAGIVLGISGIANHAFWQYPRTSHGYENRLICPQEYLAVTAACLMVKKELYQKMGGLNETDLAVAYNDVDFCLRLNQAGFHNIYCPHAEAYHYESISRGADNTIEKNERLAKESDYMLKTHASFFKKTDPFYHPALPKTKVF
jgi:GT2 family glycosyltransferase